MNNDKQFQDLIDKNKYQVFLFANLCPFPFTFAIHPWFVISKKGKLSRWEVVHFKNKVEKSWNHLSFNLAPPFFGVPIIYSYFKFRYKPKLIASSEGDENSLAKRMADFIENSPNTYPYCGKYHFVGPNSNTYVQWVLNNFPDFKVKLPWNFFGKNYKI